MSVHGGLVILVDDQPKRTVRVQLAHGTSSNDRSTGIIWIPSLSRYIGYRHSRQ
jgi:hypothetical protein